MRVYDFEFGVYRYRVDISREYTTPIEIVEKWLKENHIHGVLMPGHAFFRNRQDVILFLLMWS